MTWGAGWGKLRKKNFGGPSPGKKKIRRASFRKKLIWKGLQKGLSEEKKL